MVPAEIITSYFIDDLLVAHTEFVILLLVLKTGLGSLLKLWGSHKDP